MSPTPADLAQSPDHYLFAFEGDNALMVPMDRAAYHRSIFLDNRIAPAAEHADRVGWAILPAAPAPRTGWIFHVAHCGSTLLARALDRADGGLVLREPMALRQLAVEAVGGGDIAARLQVATRLYGRRYVGSEPTIVKANVPVNFILPDIMAHDPMAPAILLYFPLAEYLTAILRNPNHRQWLRNVSHELAPAIAATANAAPGDSDPERAGALWLAQMCVFAAALQRFPNARSLDATTLFDTPEPVLAAAFALFDRPIAPGELAALCAGPLFNTYSKNPALPFDNAARLAQRAEVAATIASEIDAAWHWVTANRGDLPDRLLPALCDAPPLLG